MSVMPARADSVRVWDLVVRLTHWAVAAIVLWDLYEDSGGPLHRNLGYAAAGLVLLRLAWGFVDSGAARFASWIPTRFGLVSYISAMAAGKPPRHLGHNPLGALAMLALWALILLLAITGWVSRLDAFWGVDWPQDLHALLADVLMALIVLHVFAAIAMSLVHKENLIVAMLTGNKRTHDDS